MYADRESGAGKLSVKERLQVAGSGRRRPKYGKRKRQEDDKLVHNLNDNKRLYDLNHRDLRLKLLNKSTQSQTENEGIRDLREKLSGSNNSLQVNNVAPKRRKVAVESKLARKVIGQVPVQEAKKVTTTISQKKSVQKAVTDIITSSSWHD